MYTVAFAMHLQTTVTTKNYLPDECVAAIIAACSLGDLCRSGKEHSFEQMKEVKVSWNMGVAQLAIGVELGREWVRKGTE